MKLPEKICLFSSVPDQDTSRTLLYKAIYVVKQILIYPLVFFVAQIVDHAEKNAKKMNRTKPQNKTKIKSERGKDNSLFIMHAELPVH